MDHFAGLDVSVKETSVCIVDDAGKILRELKLASKPEALLAVPKSPAYQAVRHQAGSLSGRRPELEGHNAEGHHGRISLANRPYRNGAPHLHGRHP